MGDATSGGYWLSSGPYTMIYCWFEYTDDILTMHNTGPSFWSCIIGSYA